MTICNNDVTPKKIVVPTNKVAATYFRNPNSWMIYYLFLLYLFSLKISIFRKKWSCFGENKHVVGISTLTSFNNSRLFSPFSMWVLKKKINSSKQLKIYLLIQAFFVFVLSTMLSILKEKIIKYWKKLKHFKNFVLCLRLFKEN